MPLVLPEIAALDAAPDGVRIPPGVTVPLTPRVRALLDTDVVRRLARVSQLGLVGLVYPGAVHSRLEHSLGVYRLALEFLARLGHDDRFAAAVGETDSAAFVAAALLHDVGHWPWCHPIEDMGLPEIPRHESLVRSLLGTGPAAAVLERDWSLDPGRVASLVEGTAADPAGRILTSLLSGPVDVDKMDYLARDSLHAGVPYGRNFDQDRLLASLCLDETGTALAISHKGRTAAELLVFARYVMFSEVYWHHAVRTATAMLQRAVWLVRDRLDVPRLVRSDDASGAALLRAAAAGSPAEGLLDGLFGPTRRLWKRVASWDAAHPSGLHRALAGRPYAAMAAVSARLADLVSSRLGRPVPADAILIDAPPAEKEVEFRLQVRERPARETGSRGNPGPAWRRLEDVSPLVRSLAHEQFDDLVKRVRIFAAPEMAEAVASCDGLEALVAQAAAS
ncbi:MAG: HD domain-containing protein [Planctomycetaceae bacterium]